MKVVDIAFVGYPVTDLKRARKFYEETLGLNVSRTFGGEEPSWIEYDIGPGTLAIVKNPDWLPSPQGAAAALEVEDFDEALNRLKEHGVEIAMGPFDSPMCRVVIFLDPDGNSIAIHKRNAEQA